METLNGKAVGFTICFKIYNGRKEKPLWKQGSF